MFMGGAYGAWLYVENDSLFFHQDNWPLYGELDLNTPIEINKWHHIAVTFQYDGAITNITLWLNGLNVDSGTSDFPAEWHDGFRIGRVLWGEDFPYSGLASQIKISSAVIYQDNFEIEYGLNNDENTFLFWDLGENEGGTLNDLSGNGNHGTIVGPTWDNDVPETSSSSGGDADYQNFTDSLLVSWLGSDEASGIASYEYALGSQSINDVVDWTDAGLETSKTLGSLSMSEGTQYTLSARATDVAGNLSQVVTGDGILIDLTPPYTGVVYDGIELQQLSDEAFTGSDSSLFGSWESFGDDVSGLAGYEVSVNDGSIYPWTAVGDVSTKKLDGLDLAHGSTYSFDVRAIDVAGNTSAVASSNGIKVDTQAPSSSVAILSDYYNQVFWDQSVQIQGSAADGTNESGLVSVEITIQNTTNGNYYNGNGWRTEATWLLPRALIPGLMNFHQES